MTRADAATWFTIDTISPSLSLIREPHVKPLLAANIWVIHGQHRDLVIDSGLGVVSLRAQVPQLFARQPALVVTHGHLDHLGGAHEFEQIWAHPDEPVDRPGRGTLQPDRLCALLGAPEGTFGDDLLIDAYPQPGYDPGNLRAAARDPDPGAGRG